MAELTFSLGSVPSGGRALTSARHLHQAHFLERRLIFSNKGPRQNHGLGLMADWKAIRIANNLVAQEGSERTLQRFANFAQQCHRGQNLATHYEKLVVAWSPTSVRSG